MGTLVASAAQWLTREEVVAALQPLEQALDVAPEQRHLLDVRQLLCERRAAVIRCRQH